MRFRSKSLTTITLEAGFSGGGFLRLALLTCSTTSICAIFLNLVISYYLWPDDFAADWIAMTLIAGGIAFALTLPISYFSYRMVQRQFLARVRAEKRAGTDFLTGVATRRAFESKAQKLLSTTRSRGALLLVDADYFKAINDTFGHSAGDEALRRLGRVLKNCIRRTDLVGRIGGEEFGIFLDGASVDDARRVAERIRSEVECSHETLPGGEGIAFTVSVGGACYLEAVPFEKCYHIADQALYRAKDAGRNRVVLIEIGPDDVSTKPANLDTHSTRPTRTLLQKMGSGR